MERRPASLDLESAAGKQLDDDVRSDNVLVGILRACTEECVEPPGGRVTCGCVDGSAGLGWLEVHGSELPVHVSLDLDLKFVASRIDEQ